MKYIKYLILLFIFISNVHAKTYYGEYGDYLSSEEVIESSDTVKVLEEKEKRYYHENYIYSDYMLDKDDTYTFISDDCKLEDKYYYEKDASIGNMKELKINNYIKKSDMTVRYIYFNNLFQNEIKMDILSIRNKDKVIDYEFKGKSFKKDNNIYDIYDKEFYIDLKDYYKKEDIRLDLMFYTESSFYMSFMHYNNSLLPIYKNYFKLNLLSTYNAHLDFSNREVNVDLIIDNLKKYESVELLDNSNYIFLETINGYVVTNKLCKYYKIEKEYSDTLDNYYDKENIDYKKKYIYQVRDKLEISDELVIEDINYDLNKFINFKSNNTKITTNLIDKTGIYDIVFELNNIKVKNKLIYLKDNTKLNIDIKNVLNEYNDIINNLYNVIGNKDKEMSKIKGEKDKLIKEYENKILNLKSIINSNKKVEESTIKKDNVLSIDIYKVSIIFTILLSILLLTVVIKKIHKIFS